VTGPELRFMVRLTPRGGSDRIDGVGEDGMLRARVSEPPVDGAANDSLVRLLAGELDLPPSAVRIAVGTSSRSKIVAVSGLGRPAILARWPGLRL
jgi:uncharacterized protein YggU (UPF0235/DUF167 family)